MAINDIDKSQQVQIDQKVFGEVKQTVNRISESTNITINQQIITTIPEELSSVYNDLKIALLRDVDLKTMLAMKQDAAILASPAPDEEKASALIHWKTFLTTATISGAIREAWEVFYAALKAHYPHLP
jgi:hypothetical protein